ncbi:hypothetical protein OBV_26150 [Oscillibacter valericigenes Sjm18-20]|nr:hypothetical protein OBV_26150 [Oscillibacter valericigenes Sjm18-20]
MLNYLFQQLINSFGIFFRTIRAFFTRKFVGLGARIRRLTNFSRQATKVASDSFQGAASALKKPTRREDYIETRRLFISKSFLILLVIGIVAAIALLYYFAWPFLLSHFFTAHFWKDDQKIPSWSGKVIVYYDKDKKNPMYRGRLEDGVLQGQGIWYAEDGNLVYEGDFADGEYSGDGSAYEDGVLIYEGTFAGGVYEGTGTLYDGGEVSYEGAFAGGEKSGLGTEYENGAKAYEGTFSGGVRSGEGIAYYPDGAVKYRGAFSDGACDGDGTEYREDGSVQYKGAFSQGCYEGDGTYYLENGEGSVQAEFASGRTNGEIKWYRSGKLWYEGSANNLTPNGFGTLYAANGKAVYAGQMKRGTLDGQWLLSQTADKIREAFGDATVSESEYSGGGFLICNAELGVLVQCSYQQEDSDASAHSAWLISADAEASMALLLPWDTMEDYLIWSAVGCTGREAAVCALAALPDGISGKYWQFRDAYEACTCTAFGKTKRGAPAALRWISNGTLEAAAADNAVGATGQAQKQMDDLLSTLDETGVGAAADSSQALQKLLAAVKTPDDAVQLVDALLDSFASRQTEDALQESETLLLQMQTDAQTQIQHGNGSEEDTDALQGELDALDKKLSQCKANGKKAELTICNLTGQSSKDVPLDGLVCSFDPAELDASALCNAVVSYASQTAEEPGSVSPENLTVQAKTALINLEVAWEEIQSARSASEKAAAEVEEQNQAYARGSVDQNALNRSMIQQNEVVADLYTALTDFTRQVNALSALSGGWVAKQCQWLADSFTPIFEAEIAQNQAQN